MLRGGAAVALATGEPSLALPCFPERRYGGVPDDELLMALPVVPRHEECPTSVPLASSDDDFEVANSEKPNPFAALAALRKDGKGT